MARGGFRAGAGRPRKSGSTDAKKTRARPVKGSSNMMPLDYMLSVMRDETVDDARRDKMAQAAAAYIHEKASESKLGKKEQREVAAKEANNVFAFNRAKVNLVVDND